MPIERLFGTTVEVLGKSIDLRARNQNYLAANVANADTPGYTPSRLSFESELKDALKEQRAPTTAARNPRHIPLKGQGEGIQEVRGRVIETPAAAPGRDGNGVEIENEMSRMAENQIMYNASVQLLVKKFDGLKQAIGSK